jgi:hypothetical protein
VVARTHKTLIWDRTRQVQRLRRQLREYFPAARAAFETSMLLTPRWAAPAPATSPAPRP